MYITTLQPINTKLYCSLSGKNSNNNKQNNKAQNKKYFFNLYYSIGYMGNETPNT